jgi:3-dehydroquinate synthetase
MVDASIGGKVAVDHPAGKNLIGAWKFPRAVIADVDVLQTLPAAELQSGLAEVVKHGVIGDTRLFEELEGTTRLGPELIARAMRVKIDIVERDPFEQNVRAHLNLGHTFGHGLENLSNYRLRHGQAVAIGTAVAARLAMRIGWCDRPTRDRIIGLLEKQALPTRISREFQPEQIIAAMGADKKIREGRLRLVLPRAIGQVDIAENLPRAEIIAALSDSLE